MNRQRLHELYVEQKLSLNQIASLQGCSHSAVYYWIKKYGIPRRTSTEGRNLNPPSITYKKGSAHPFFGKKHSEETKKRISSKNSGRVRPQGEQHFNFGRKHSVKQKEKWSKERTGKDNPGWRGGKTSLYNRIRHCKLYNNWRLSVFERDSFTCQDCGDDSGGNLNADHIKPFALILKENNIKNFELAAKDEDLWDTNNGKTLCVSCHKKTPTYGVGTKKMMEN